ncbi:MAG: ATP-binding protein [Oscillospiraceae bacterium]|nr:ATP-binding protein [Oscillospiraceae bacterium]
MKIHSVTLKNFKSIGENKNAIILEPNVTAIIGKNESGKSNVLEGLSKISLLGNMERNGAFNPNNANRNNGIDSDMAYTIVLKPTKKECDSLHISGDTKITISKNSYEVTGSILDYYNTVVREGIDRLVLALGKNPFSLRNQDLTNYNSNITVLKSVGTLDLRSINAIFSYIRPLLQKLTPDSKEAVLVAFDDAETKWNSLTAMLPSVFYRNADRSLMNWYNLDTVKKELANPATASGSLLPKFLELINISNEDFISALRTDLNASVRETKRQEIHRNIESKFNVDFKKFYTTERISLSAGFESNAVNFFVKSEDGAILSFSERSNGLRWYINLFIEANARDTPDKNVVYLLDEPGTSLHINAQRKLLELFGDLASKGNQVVYTTHLPSMLDTENDGLYRIRAVEKDAAGYTHIFDKAYDQELCPDDREDTLAPIISAIGMNLHDTFGPARNKLNIVTEGMSDCIYMHTMAKKLGYDLSKLTFIPADGAANSKNICSILYGWGCPFCAVFDYDKAGVETGGEVFRKNFGYVAGKQFLYLKEIEQDEVDNKTYSKKDFQCAIEDVVTREELKAFAHARGIAEDTGKTLIAKLYSNAVEDGSHTPSEQCQANFKTLLDRIKSIRESTLHDCP